MKDRIEEEANKHRCSDEHTKDCPCQPRSVSVGGNVTGSTIVTGGGGGALDELEAALARASKYRNQKAIATLTTLLGKHSLVLLWDDTHACYSVVSDHAASW